MPDYISYIKSISSEVLAIKDRVRNFVKHYPEDGRYKEIILMDILRQKLPKTVSVGTGFVMDKDDNPSTQIDIIIYNDICPPYFKQGDFVIVNSEATLGIIEVKSRFNNATEIESAINKSYENKAIIGNIFNVIFAFDCDINVAKNDTLKQLLEQNKHSKIDYITFNKDIFMKYWRAKLPNNTYKNPHYSFYNIQDMAIGYFISNIIEIVNIKIRGRNISKSLEKFLYPIENGGKENYRIADIELE